MTSGCRQRLRWLPWGVVLVAFAGLAIAHEGHDKPSKDRIVVGDVITVAKEARAVLGIRTEDAQPRLMESTLTAIGIVEVRPEARAFASTLLAGVVESIHVVPGQRVEAGAVLAMLRSQELERLLLERATANLEVDLAEKELTRTENFVKQRLRNQRDLLLAQARRTEKANAALVTKLKLEALGVQNDAAALLRIASPIAGQIARVEAIAGAFVDPAQQLFEIVQPTTQRVRIQVPAAHVAKLQLGQLVRAARDPASSDQGPRLEGHLVARTGTIDARTLTESFWAEFPSEQTWLPGKRLQTQVVLSQKPDALSVPETALVRDGMETFVFVQIDPKKFKRTRIVPGLRAQGYVEATSGLLTKDPVVTQGAWQLASRFGYGSLKPSKEAMQATALRVATPSIERIDHVVELDATVTLAPTDQSVIATVQPGKVAELLVGLPGEVEGGQPLARITSIAVQELQIGMLQAELAIQLQTELLAGYNKALREQPMVVPEQQLQEANNALQQAQARAASFRRQLLAAGFTADEIDQTLRERRVSATLTLRAPRSGYVVPGDLAIGKVVQPSETLFSLRTTEGLWIRARVPTRDAETLRPGQATRFRAFGLDDVLTGRIERIDPIASDDNLRHAWVHVPRPPEALRPGMLGRLTVVLEEGQEALALPRSAILTEGSLHRVFVEKDGQFAPRTVTLGESDDRHVAIRGGVTADERVAQNAVLDLRRGYGRIK